MKKVCAAAVFAVLFYAGAFADEFYLKTGEILNAEILNTTDSGYIIKDGDMWKELSKNDVSYVKSDKKAVIQNSIRKNEFIIKAGGNFATSLDCDNKKNNNPSFSSSDTVFFGFDFFMPVMDNLSLGAGTKVNLVSNVNDGFGNFYSVPFFISAKIQAPVSENNRIYTSFNIGTSFFGTSDEFLLTSNSPPFDKRDIQMMPYFGLNLGMDLNRLIFEIGFSFENYKISRDSSNSSDPDNLYITRTSLSIGYRI